MTGTMKPAISPPELACARLERCRIVIAEAFRRQRLTDAEVARALQLDRSYLGKVRRGERPLTEATLEHLIVHLRLDRPRLALAIDVMEDPELYWDGAFRNICYYAQTMLGDIVAMSRDGGGLNRGTILAALPRDRCEALARVAVARLSDQFAALDPLITIVRAA